MTDAFSQQYEIDRTKRYEVKPTELASPAFRLVYGGEIVCTGEILAHLNQLAFLANASKTEGHRSYEAGLREGEEENKRLRGALTALRAGIIRHAKDTVWFGMGETAVDFITSTLGDADKCICDAKTQIGCPIHDPR